MDVPMELSRIVISELGDQQVIFLREKGGSQRSFPILIGISEALAIDRRLKGVETPRPMTHDLLASVIEAMGGTLERIVINDILDHTFIATLFIRRGHELVSVDSRPSDAIALGAAFNTPIYVAEHVLENVLNENVTMEDRIDLLRRRLDMLNQQIEEVRLRLEDDDFLEKASEEIVQEHRRQLEAMQSEATAIEQALKKLK
jgi:bifunctional DNase/RNase